MIEPRWVMRRGNRMMIMGHPRSTRLEQRSDIMSAKGEHFRPAAVQAIWHYSSPKNEGIFCWDASYLPLPFEQRSMPLRWRCQNIVVKPEPDIARHGGFPWTCVRDIPRGQTGHPNCGEDLWPRAISRSGRRMGILAGFVHVPPVHERSKFVHSIAKSCRDNRSLAFWENSPTSPASEGLSIRSWLNISMYTHYGPMIKEDPTNSVSYSRQALVSSQTFVPAAFRTTTSVPKTCCGMVGVAFGWLILRTPYLIRSGDLIKTKLTLIV